MGVGAVWAQEARLNEMNALITSWIEEAADKEIMLSDVEAYMEQRHDALAMLAGLVASTSENELQGSWESIVDNMIDLPELDGLDDDVTTDAAIEVYEQLYEEERDWWLALQQIDPVLYRDALVQQRLDLVSRTQLLETKWQETLNEDLGYDERERDAIEELTETYAATMQELRDGRERIRGYVGIVADVAANDIVGTMFIPGALGDIVNIAATTVKTVAAWQSAAESKRLALEAFATQELKLVQTFLVTRADTQLFVDENGLDAMKAQIDSAERELRDFEGRGTSGQRSDAANFTSEMRASLSTHGAAITTDFNTFVTKHFGRFFGPIAPDVREALLETQFWAVERAADEERRSDLHELLTAWRDESEDVFEFDVSRQGITDEEWKFIQDYLAGDFEALNSAMEEGQAFIQRLATVFDRTGLEQALE